MRSASSLLPLLTLCAGCLAPHPYVVGTVSYTAASPGSSTSGALPLRAVACPSAAASQMSIHLGDRCVLRGPVGGTVHTGSVTGRLTSTGACALPGVGGDPLSLQAATATYENVGYAVDTTVSGTTEDGRYVTYRFTGRFEDGPKETCETLEGKVDLPVTDGTTRIAPGREAWEVWVPEPQVRQGSVSR